MTAHGLHSHTNSRDHKTAAAKQSADGNQAQTAEVQNFRLSILQNGAGRTARKPRAPNLQQVRMHCRDLKHRVATMVATHSLRWHLQMRGYSRVVSQFPKDVTAKLRSSGEAPTHFFRRLALESLWRHSKFGALGEFRRRTSALLYRLCNAR